MTDIFDRIRFRAGDESSPRFVDHVSLQPDQPFHHGAFPASQYTDDEIDQEPPIFEPRPVSVIQHFYQEATSSLDKGELKPQPSPSNKINQVFQKETLNPGKPSSRNSLETLAATPEKLNPETSKPQKRSSLIPDSAVTQSHIKVNQNDVEYSPKTAVTASKNKSTLKPAGNLSSPNQPYKPSPAAVATKSLQPQFPKKPEPKIRKQPRPIHLKIGQITVTAPHTTPAPAPAPVIQQRIEKPVSDIRDYLGWKNR